MCKHFRKAALTLKPRQNRQLRILACLAWTVYLRLWKPGERPRLTSSQASVVLPDCRGPSRTQTGLFASAD